MANGTQSTLGSRERTAELLREASAETGIEAPQDLITTEDRQPTGDAEVGNEATDTPASDRVFNRQEADDEAAEAEGTTPTVLQGTGFQQQQQQAQERQKTLRDRVSEALTGVSNIPQEQQRLREESGIPGQEERLSEVNTRIAEIQKDFRNRMDTIRQAPGATQRQLSALEAQERREKADKLADQRIIQSALQGNIERLEQNVQDKVDVITEARQQELEQARNFLQNNRDVLTDLQKTRLDESIRTKRNQLERQRKKAQNLQEARNEILGEAARNNAPTSVLNRIQTAQSQSEALSAASGYLNPGERIGNADVDTEIQEVGGRTVLVNTQTGEVIRDISEQVSGQELQAIQNTPPGVEPAKLPANQIPQNQQQQPATFTETMDSIIVENKNASVTEIRNRVEKETGSRPLASEVRKRKKLLNPDTVQSLIESKLEAKNATEQFEKQEVQDDMINQVSTSLGRDLPEEVRQSIIDAVNNVYNQ